MPPVATTDDCSTASFSVHSPPKREIGKMRRRHSVDFVPEERTVEIEVYDDEARTDIWYNRDEYDIIKARNALIIKMMKTGSFEESEEHSFRGLEHKLKDGFRQRRANKFNALNAVLEEQDRQMSQGVMNPDIIAESYRRVSLNAKENAFVLACRDAEESYAHAMGGHLYPNDVHNSDEEDETVNPEDDGDLTDADTVCTEDSNRKKTRLRRLFGGVSKIRKEKTSRRSSM